MPLPKITIITPSFNQGQYLEQTIDSVLSQNYPNLEYMIFDGGSGDDTVDIIRKYQKYLTYWESREDGGQSEAINKGFKRASGEIVNWLNSDDYYEKDALFHVAEAFGDELVLMVTGKSRIFQGAETIGISQGTDIYPGNLPKTLGWARIDQPETFFRRTAIEEIGYLKPSLHYVMDRELWIRYLLRFGLSPCRSIDQVLVNFRLHPKSKTSQAVNEFDMENLALYAGYAKAFGMNAETELLRDLSRPSNLSIEISSIPDSEITRNMISYFLLLKGNEYYAAGMKKQAERCLQLANPELLAVQDRRLLRKLRFRNKFPSALTSALRRK